MDETKHIRERVRLALSQWNPKKKMFLPLKPNSELRLLKKGFLVPEFLPKRGSRRDTVIVSINKGLVIPQTTRS